MQFRSYLLLAVTMTFVDHAESAKILGLFQLNSRSHFVMFEALLKGLAAKGHQVYVVSHFPQKESLPNYNDINLEGSLPNLVNNFTIEFARELKYVNMFEFIWYRMLDICDIALGHPEFQKMINGNEKFDLVITEIVGADCFLGAVEKLQAPVIGMISGIAFPWSNDRIGNPDNPSYIPNIFVWFTHHMSFCERLFNTVLTEGLKIAHYYLGEIPMERLSKKYFGENIPSLSELMKKTSLVFVNSHFTFNFPRPTVPAFVEVGGLHIQTGKKLPKELEDFINGAEHGVIYFCLGSLVRGETLPKDTLEVFINVFKKLPQRVLWKIDNVTGLPSNIMTSKWLPQFEILSHPNVRVFINHGGLMGTQEALYTGVPMVGIPLFSDQHLNVRNCVQRGISVMVEFDSISEETVSEALNKVLNDPSYQRNAKQLSQLFQDRPHTPLETAIFWTEYVIRHKGAPHLRTAAVELPLYQYLLLDVIAFLSLIVISISIVVIFTVKRLYRLCCGGPKTRKLKSN